MKAKLSCFRPLPGDLISQLVRKFLNTIWHITFPSPSRGSYFSIIVTRDIEQNANSFPSPSRGSYFSIIVTRDIEQNANSFPSPSRGSYFSMLLRVLIKTFPLYKLFPSPSRGSYFSIWCNDYGGWHDWNVSVPFPGILFLNKRWLKRGSSAVFSFRPLPGDLISQ